MVPDKIYIEEGYEVPVVGFVSPAWNKAKDLDEPIEYVRKSAVVEVIERRIKSIESCPFIEAEFGAEYKRDGQIRAYKDVLSIIESMQD